jgi:hypothetical protein
MSSVRRSFWVLFVLACDRGGGGALVAGDAGSVASDQIPDASEADAAPGGPTDSAAVAGPDAPVDASGADAPPLDPAAAARRYYGLQVGARWTYRRYGGLQFSRDAANGVAGGGLRWKEITACEEVPLYTETGAPMGTTKGYVRENRSQTGTTSVHYLVNDRLGVRRVRRDDVDQGSLAMVATYSPASPRLLDGPYSLGRRWAFTIRTAEFEWAPGAGRFTSRGANETTALDVVNGLDERTVVAGTFPTVGIDRQWGPDLHNVQSFYSPGVGEVIEVTTWPRSPLPMIQVEELVSFTPGYGSCDGSPVVNAAPCNPPLLVCEAPWGVAVRGCTDPRVDPANCGGCGRTCPSGVCANGVCQTSACPISCAGSSICCPNAWRWGSAGCTNPNRDPWNCGGCGIACRSGQFCDHGACRCAEGTRDCGGRCVSVLRDPMNCGACGNVCGSATPKCDLGICYGSCKALDLIECDGACVNPQWDSNHCGTCGRKCGPGTLQCRAGECIPCAKGGYADCDGTCFDLAWSNLHCGACGNACPKGQVCARGKCIGGDGSGECKDPEKISCKGNCINPRSSDTNCGGCGVAMCRGGCTEACREGMCVRVACGGGDD